jgi:hypothetical protein
MAQGHHAPPRTSGQPDFFLDKTGVANLDNPRIKFSISVSLVLLYPFHSFIDRLHYPEFSFPVFKFWKP